MRVRRTVAALVALGVVGLGGCGNAVVPVAGRPPVVAPPSTSADSPSSAPSPPPGSVSATPSVRTSPSASPAPVPTPSPTTLTVADRTVRGWPAGVTLPPRTTVVATVPDSRGGSVTLSGTSRSALVEHLSAQLSAAGMAVQVDSAGTFHFRGAGWAGQVAADGSYVTMRWLVGDAAHGRYPEDVGLGPGVPALMRYPAGATVSTPRAAWTGASYDLTGRAPAELLAFYRADLVPLFTITGDLNENGVTTLTFTDAEYDTVVTATETSFRVVHTRRS